MAWALVVDEGGRGNEQIVGVVVQGDLVPEPITPDDPSFLGYAGPGDQAIERGGRGPDWNALARQAIAELKQAR